MIQEITHSDKPIATGTVMLHGGRNGGQVTGRLVTEFGDTFIVVRTAGINDYNKVDPSTVELS